ncbi:GTP-binding protein [Alteromonas sediminis]|uniref:GTP-binding protein n=1 Tax=Alteromonas sediminis TaxID=2259342 RepID=A0A3N5Y127_9ALTE|nr:GTP-binding protein [Alteromonas sediminis]RPJ66633.1 GTP-binding protein [Alteromonas sediminis]
MLLQNIPTNIITGALGVGKTTLIQHLLSNKPHSERWAVLVNEFGEVGIDGALLVSQGGQQDIYIKEVPGGCMCCTSGLPMQIALNLLLTEAKPDRLIIEPTGLGHPTEVLQTLCRDEYKGVLDIQATLTLLDARKLNDTKWRQHPVFAEQIQIADCIVLTKSDLYLHDLDLEISTYLDEQGVRSTPLKRAEKGIIDPSILHNPSAIAAGFLAQQEAEKQHTHGHTHADVHASSSVEAPTKGVISVRNQGEGFYSRGWICSPERWLDYQTCRSLFTELQVDRLKAVVITEEGVFSFNIADGVVGETSLDSAKDSRIEFITDNEAVADNLAERIEETLAF